MEERSGLSFLCKNKVFFRSESSFSLRNLSVASIGTDKRDSSGYCLGARSQAGKRAITLVALSNADSDVFDYLSRMVREWLEIGLTFTRRAIA